MFDIYKYASDPGKELLVALEAQRKVIEKRDGIGSYMKWNPWKDIFAQPKPFLETIFIYVFAINQNNNNN